MYRPSPVRRRIAAPLSLAALSALLLAGCTSFSADGGMDDVAALTHDRTGQPVRRTASDEDRAMVRTKVRELLAHPLTPDAAVEIALLNNRGLQASLAELGVAEADLVQAGRLRNPGFSFSRVRGGGATEIDRGVAFDLAGLLTIPIRTGIERGRFEQARLQAASDAVRLAADTRRAWVEAVAAAQSAAYAEQVEQSAEAGAELAQRMARVGNWSALDQAREQAFYADAAAQLAQARQQALAARERLTRLLGLWGDEIRFRLPERLPDLPNAPDAPRDIEARAMERRLDVQMARRATEATAKALGLSKATRFVNVLDAGYVNKSQTGSTLQEGYEVSLEFPLFDWDTARVAKAESLYLASMHRTAEVAVRARSEVREAYSRYRTSYDVARHYRDEVVPLRRKISDEVLLRYNGMLAGVFELLADAREQAQAVRAAIDAQRDFWLAQTDLRAATEGSGTDRAGKE